MDGKITTDLANKHLKMVIDLCYEMLELADHGDKSRLDAGCGVVFGTLRDVAYKVRKLAEKELLQHDGAEKIYQGDQQT